MPLHLRPREERSRSRVRGAFLASVASATLALAGLVPLAPAAHAAATYDLVNDALGTAKIESFTSASSQKVLNETTPATAIDERGTIALSGTINDYGRFAAGDTVRICMLTENPASPQQMFFDSTSPNLPETNPVFTVTAQGNCLNLQRNSVGGGGALNFNIQAVGRLWPTYSATAGKLSTYSIGGNTYKIALNLQQSYDDYVGADASWGATDPLMNGGLVWPAFGNGAAWQAALSNNPLPANTADVVVMSKVTPAAGTSIVGVRPQGNVGSYVNKVSADNTKFNNTPINMVKPHGDLPITVVQGLKQDATLEYVSGFLRPGQATAAQNSDGSWTLAVNYGPRANNQNFVVPADDSVQPADANTLALMQKARDLKLLYQNIATPFFVDFADSTKAESAKVETVTNAVAGTDTRTVSDQPVSNKATNQTAIRVHYIDEAGVDRAPVDTLYGYPAGTTDPATGTSTPAQQLTPKQLADYQLMTDANQAANAIRVPVGEVATGPLSVSFPASGETNVYYVYQRLYSVNYDLNGGTAAMPGPRGGVKWTDGGLLPKNGAGQAITPTRAMYNFAGWKAVGGGNGAVVNDGHRYADIAQSSSATSVTLQAQWTPADTDGDGVSDVDETNYGSNPNVPDTWPKTIRLAGDSRYTTAIQISQRTATPGSEVFIARGDLFADALAGGPAAAKRGGVLLLTPGDRLLPEVKAEIERIRPSKITVLGTENAVSAAVYNALTPITSSVSRIGGTTRIETAAMIAEQVFGTSNEAMLATGWNFPDALALAAAASIGDPKPVLLTSAQSLSPATKDVIVKLGAKLVRVGGDFNAVSASAEDSITSLNIEVKRYAGADRYATAAKIASDYVQPDRPAIYATGQNFPDALVSASLSHKYGAPLLLATNTCRTTAMEVAAGQFGQRYRYLLGGTNTLPDSVLTTTCR